MLEKEARSHCVRPPLCRDDLSLDRMWNVDGSVELAQERESVELAQRNERSGVGKDDQGSAELFAEGLAAERRQQAAGVSRAGEIGDRHPSSLGRGSEGHASLAIQLKGPVDLHLAKTPLQKLQQ